MTNPERVDSAFFASPHIEPNAVEWLFEHSTDALILGRLDGRILRANAAATRMLRMTETEIRRLGREGLLVHKDALTNPIEERAEKGSAQAEATLRRGDGSEFLAELTSAALPFGTEPLAYVRIRDLTERERTTRALHESEQRYAAIYENAPIPILLVKLPEVNIVSANPAFLELLEFELREVVGKTLLDIGLSHAPNLEVLSSTLMSVEHLRNRIVTRSTRSGKALVLSFNVQRISLDGLPHILLTIVDMTAHVRGEEALRASQERLSLFVQQAPTSIAVFDSNMHYLAHSQRFLTDFGLPDKTLVGRSHHDVFPIMPEELRAVHQRCTAGASERSEGTPFVTPNGSLEWYRWEMVPWYDGHGEIGGAVLYTERVTELMQAKERLANQERLLADLIDGSPAIISAFDRDGRIMFVNKAAADSLKLTKEAIRGTRAVDYLPDARAINFIAHHREVMETGHPQLLEMTLPEPNAHIAVLAARYPLRDTSGAVYGTASIMTDITRQKQIEADLRQSEEKTREALAALEIALEDTRRTEEKFRQVQKMEAVGRLAGGIAHDFNNLLTVILGNSSELLAGLSPEDPQSELISEIEKAGQRAAALTQQLLAFSRKQMLEPRIVDVNELILHAEKMLRRIVSEDIELTLLLDPSRLPCKLDRGQFEQVLLNLVVNARDAMAEGGRLTITTSRATLDARFVEEHPDVKIGEHVRITITDTGVGISKDVQAHIFEPFFTTKGVGRGTGLGLSTAYGIIRQSGGTIWVHSEPAQGTTFQIYFPVQSSGLLEAVSASKGVSKARRNETILLVEDEDQVRNTISNILARADYFVLTAANGGEALLICEQHQRDIQLLLTDVVMPKLNGKKLAERLRQVRPHMRVLYMSGYAENVVVHHGIVDAGLHFLAKPITANALLAKVRDVLDQ